MAAGLARAKSLKAEPGFTIAVIGDGAFTGGMAYEALNNAGHYKDRIIIVLNDNEMSIFQKRWSLCTLSGANSLKTGILLNAG